MTRRNVMALLLVASSIAVGMVHLVSPATANNMPGETLALEAVTIGDRARYSGPFEFEVVATSFEEGLDRAGRRIATLEFNVSSSMEPPFHVGVGVESGRIEYLRYPCVERVMGNCTPLEEIIWTAQGGPFLGATLMAGREYAVGSQLEWLGDCRTCTGPLRADITQPTPTAPQGAVASMIFSGTNGFVLTPFVAHVDEHSLPLGFEAHAGAFQRVSFTRGEGIVAVLGDDAPSYEALVTPSPFVDGLPTEGKPEPPFSSLSSARSATSDPPVRYPSTIVHMALSIGSTTFSTPQKQTTAFMTTTWSLDIAEQTGDMVARTFMQERPLPTIVPNNPALLWTRTESPSMLTYPSSLCTAESAPVWDLVRTAYSFGLIPAYDGLDLALGCEPSLRIYGRGTESTGTVSVAVEPSTGLLIDAYVDASRV